MFDFSKPAEGTFAAMTSGGTPVSAHDSKKDKKEKKEKKEKKDKKDKKDKDRDEPNRMSRDNSDNDDNNKTNQQNQAKNASQTNLPTPPTTSPRGNNNVATAVPINTNFGFFMAGATGGFSLNHQQNMMKNSSSPNNNHNNSQIRNTPMGSENSSLNVGLQGGSSKSMTPNMQHNANNNNNGNKNSKTNNNLNDDDDSDIEEVNLGEAVVIPLGSSKHHKSSKTAMQQQEQASASSTSSSTQNNNNNSHHHHHHHHHETKETEGGQKLSEEERIRASQLAMQKQFQDFGLYGNNQDKKNTNTNNAGAKDSEKEPDDFNFEKVDVLAKMQHEDILEFIPKTLLCCNLLRQKGGFFDNNIYFRLKSDFGDHFILSARKRSLKSTTNFVITGSETSTSKKSDQFFGKVRGNAAKTEYIVYDQGDRPENGYFDEVASLQQQQHLGGANGGDNSNYYQNQSVGTSVGEGLREELAYILYTANLVGSSGARKMFVILPKPDPHFGRPTRHYKPRNEHETMKAHWKCEPTKFLTLENKEPTWNEALRAYQLNFKGRVKEQSVKNFQLVESSNKNRVVLQVGKAGDDEFAVDFQAPLTAFLALSIALTAFDGSITRE